MLKVEKFFSFMYSMITKFFIYALIGVLCVTTFKDAPTKMMIMTYLYLIVVYRTVYISSERYHKFLMIDKYIKSYAWMNKVDTRTLIKTLMLGTPCPWVYATEYFVLRQYLDMNRVKDPDGFTIEENSIHMACSEKFRRLHLNSIKMSYNIFKHVETKDSPSYKSMLFIDFYLFIIRPLIILSPLYYFLREGIVTQRIWIPNVFVYIVLACVPLFIFEQLVYMILFRGKKTDIKIKEDVIDRLDDNVLKIILYANIITNISKPLFHSTSFGREEVFNGINHIISISNKIIHSHKKVITPHQEIDKIIDFLETTTSDDIMDYIDNYVAINTNAFDDI